VCFLRLIVSSRQIEDLWKCFQFINEQDSDNVCSLRISCPDAVKNAVVSTKSIAIDDLNSLSNDGQSATILTKSHGETNEGKVNYFNQVWALQKTQAG
jgi:hypothetical protein